MKKLSTGLLAFLACAALNAQIIIDDTAGVNVSDHQGSLASDFIFKGVLEDPVKALLNVDADTVFDVSQGRMSTGGFEQGHGGLKVQGGIKLTFQNANGDQDMGGALNVFQRSFVLSGGESSPILFTNNHLAPSRTQDNPVGGGAIGLQLELTVLDATNVVFRNNSATASNAKGTLGGAVFSYMATSTFTNAVFENNRAVSNGGGPVGGGALAAEFLGSSTPSRGVFIYGGSFKENEALLNFNGSQAAIGGAIMVQNQQLTIEGSTATPVLFKDNKATHAYSGSAYGGAIALLSNQSASTLADVRFEGNTAGNAAGGNGYGGGVYVQGLAASAYAFTRADFEGNTAQYGGAVYVMAGAVEFNDANMQNNTADFGGALYSASGTNISFNVSAGNTSTVSGNTTSGGQMSGIYLGSASSFTVNTAAGAVFDMQDSIYAVAGLGTALSKKGTGTWKMGGENKLTSADSSKYAVLDVEAGTLEMIAGSSLDMEGESSAFNLEAGALFDVTALSVAASVNVAGTLTLSSQSTVKFDGGNLNSNTAIINAGKFGLDIAPAGSKVVIDIENLSAGSSEDRYALFTFDDLVADYGTGGDANDYFVLRGVNSNFYSFEWDDGILYIIVQNIPEPAAWAVFFGLLALSFAAYRKKRPS